MRERAQANVEVSRAARRPDQLQRLRLLTANVASALVPPTVNTDPEPALRRLSPPAYACGPSARPGWQAGMPGGSSSRRGAGSRGAADRLSFLEAALQVLERERI